MSVLVEGISIIIKAEAIITKYPGGWKSFKDNPPNKTLCDDTELARLGFMSPDDVGNYIKELEAFDFQHILGNKAIDLVVADQQRGFTSNCEWAEFGFIDLDNNPEQTIAVCRLVNSTIQEIIFPDDWDFESSLSSQFQFVETDKKDGRMKILREEDGMEVYLDIESGKEVYLGRPKK